MRNLVMIGLMIGLGACQPQGLKIAEVAKDAPQGALPENVAKLPATACDARAERSWPISATETLAAEAVVFGPACETAVVTLVVRDKAQAPLLAWAARTQDVFGLYDVKDAAGMKTALNDFLDPESGTFKTSADLPAWAKGSNVPGKAGEEFPFHPEEGMDQQVYEDLRKLKTPVFTFPQGHESLAVYTLRDGQLESIGVQQFPG